MTPRFTPLQDCPAQAWRNGGGQTRELLAWPHAEAWRLRISVADVAQDGPFSVLEGVQRELVVWQGAGLALQVGSALESQRLTPLSPPFSFAGEWPVTAYLVDGPVRDLNLMRRGLGGGLHAAAPHQAWAPVCQAAGVFATQAGRCWARPVAESSAVLSWRLPAATLCWFDVAPAELWWAPDVTLLTAMAWWLEADLKATTG